MRKHGKGPKHLLVRKYPRWQRGHRRRVGTHTRGASPKLSLRKAPEQLRFGF